MANEGEAIRHGDRLQVVPVERLKDLETDIMKLKKEEELNGFQQWILDGLYNFKVPDTAFEVKSIIIMALYHPFSAVVEFNHEARTYTTRSLVRADFHGARKYLSDMLSSLGYHYHEVFNLPMKRLAVQSGLALYGRNNITYVEDLGSNISYLAFFSDIPCEQDDWREVCQAGICDKCNACISACPTRAIRSDRFLIDNERCLSAINESGGEFPDWLPKDVHHTLYDCLRCQEKCPLNAKTAKDTIGPIRFNEVETSMLLEGKRPEAFSEEFMKKANIIALFDWSDGLPRNIRAIINIAKAKMSIE